jgi:WhiB family redox-sensing transcriptional regulator
VTGTGSLVPAPDNQQHVTMSAGTREGSRNWMSCGACHGADTELFFPIATAGRALKQVNSAKAVCGRCTVHADCLSYALETMQHGIWGGTTGEERAAMRARSRRALSPTARREDEPNGPRGPGMPAGRSAPGPLRETGPA